MRWPTFTMKQLLVAVFLICLGMTGVSFFLRSERGFLPTAALVVGGVCMLVGIIQLITERRRTMFLVLALLGAIPGGLMGWSVAETVGAVTGEVLGAAAMRRDTLIAFACMAIGSLFVLAMLLVRDSRNLPAGDAAE